MRNCWNFLKNVFDLCSVEIGDVRSIWVINSDLPGRLPRHFFLCHCSLFGYTHVSSNAKNSHTLSRNILSPHFGRGDCISNPRPRHTHAITSLQSSPATTIAARSIACTVLPSLLSITRSTAAAVGSLCPTPPPAFMVYCTGRTVSRIQPILRRMASYPRHVQISAIYLSRDIPRFCKYFGNLLRIYLASPLIFCARFNFSLQIPSNQTCGLFPSAAYRRAVPAMHEFFYPPPLLWCHSPSSPALEFYV